MREVEYGIGGERIVRMEGRAARYVLAASPEDMQEATRRHEFMRHLDRLARRGEAFPGMRGSIPGAAWIVNTGTSALALVGATAKTCWYINNATNDLAHLCEFAIGFDGVTAANVPALVELVLSTKATNSTPGTNSTSFTPVQTRGANTQASACTAANACSSEPTVLTVTRNYLVTPNGGLLLVQFPLGREFVGTNIASTAGLQIGLRANAPNAVNIRSFGEFEEG